MAASLASTLAMAEPVTTEVATAGAEDAPRPETALSLLRRRDFRRAYGAVAISELGDAFQYIALMWFALVAGGPLGVIAVRLADSVPAIVFGLHGGVVADRWDRRRVMIVLRSRSRPRARAGCNRRPLRPPAAGCSRRRRIRPHRSYELLRSGVWRPPPRARRSQERATGQRPRSRDGGRALGRRLGARGTPSHVPADQRLLRAERGVVLHLGADARGSPDARPIRLARSNRRESAKASPCSGPGPRSLRRSSCSGLR